MADLSFQDFESLRGMSPHLKTYARISEQDIAGSFIFLDEHSIRESGLAEVEMLLEAAAENYRRGNMRAALSMVHQAALMRKYLSSDKTSLGAFRSGLMQEDFDLTSSWTSEVSRYFLALVGEVPRHPITSRYADLVFKADELGLPTNLAIETANLDSGYPDDRESTHCPYEPLLILIGIGYYVRKRPEQFFKPGRVCFLTYIASWSLIVFFRSSQCFGRLTT